MIDATLAVVAPDDGWPYADAALLFSSVYPSRPLDGTQAAHRVAADPVLIAEGIRPS